MMKVNTYEQVQRLYEDSISKRNENPFAVSKDKTEKSEEAAIYSPSAEQGKAARTGKGAVVRNDESKLSEGAKKLLEKLREKFGDMDVMVADFTSESEAQSILSHSSKEYSVLLTTDELEKMAADEDYASSVEDKISSAVDQMKSMAEKIQEKIDQGEEGYEDLMLTGMSVSFDSDGNATFFASLEKLTEKQKEHIAKVKEAREAEKNESKKTESNSREDKLSAYHRIDWEGKMEEQIEFPRKALVSGSSEEELLEAITGIDWSRAAAMPFPVAGGKLDVGV